MKQLLFGLVIGVAGVAVLLSLGVWQLRRLDWKEGIIAAAEEMMATPPVALPAAPDPGADRYRPVQVTGAFTGPEVHVLTSTREKGPGFLVITAFRTDDNRLILVDRGFVPETAKDTPRPATTAKVTGNLAWPDDKTSATPDPDLARNIWFGRDLPAMASQLGTEPVLVVARSPTGNGITPMPAAATFRNDHLNYAITWFALAVVWAGMTLAYLWRIRRPTN